MKKLSCAAFALSAILTVTFAGLLARDYLLVYPFGSAPFYLYAAVRAAELLVPAAICLAIGIALRRKL